MSAGVTNLDRAGWAIAYTIVQWRRQVSPVLRKAEKELDPDQRAALMRQAADYLEAKVTALRSGADLAEEKP